MARPGASPQSRSPVPDIFDEVEEDLRADQAKALLKRYGGALIGAAVLVVIGAGAWQAWQWYDARETAKVATAYMDAAHTADTAKGSAREQAAGAFAAVAKDAPAGYRTLALLREAGIKADAGDVAGASAIWDAVAGDGRVDPLLRDLATLQWALHHVDDGDPAQVATRLAPLLDASNPYHPLAQEAVAMLDLRQGKTEAARKTLQALEQDASAPQGLRQRANGMLTRLGGSG
jgi:hypothetical protein